MTAPMRSSARGAVASPQPAADGLGMGGPLPGPIAAGILGNGALADRADADLREIMDCLSLSSPVQRVALMKGAQIGDTEWGNCSIGYGIKPHRWGGQRAQGQFSACGSRGPARPMPMAKTDFYPFGRWPRARCSRRASASSASARAARTTGSPSRSSCSAVLRAPVAHEMRDPAQRRRDHLRDLARPDRAPGRLPLPSHPSGRCAASARPASWCGYLVLQVERLRQIEARIAALEGKLVGQARDDEACRRLTEAPGIGPGIATAMMQRSAMPGNSAVVEASSPGST